jgi:hypothetical protein
VGPFLAGRGARAGALALRPLADCNGAPYDNLGTGHFQFHPDSTQFYPVYKVWEGGAILRDAWLRDAPQDEAGTESSGSAPAPQRQPPVTQGRGGGGQGKPK